MTLAHKLQPNTRMNFCLVLAALLLLLPISSTGWAAIRLDTRGPKSAEIAAAAKKALARQGIENGTLSVYVKRHVPDWQVVLKFSAGGGSSFSLVRAYNAPHGLLPGNATSAFAASIAYSLREQAKAVARKNSKEKSKDKESSKKTPHVAPPPSDEPGSYSDLTSLTEDQSPPPETETPTPKSSRRLEKLDSNDLGFEVAPKNEDSPQAPPPAPHRKDDLGFDVAAKTSAATKKDEEPTVYKKNVSDDNVEEEAEEEKVIFDIQVGMGLAWRRFLYYSSPNLIDYNTGTFSLFQMTTDIYPLHFLIDSAASTLGLRLSYDHSAGYVSDIYQEGIEKQLETHLTRYWIGLNYIAPAFAAQHAPRFSVRLGLTHHGMETEANPLIFDSSMTSIAVGASMEIEIMRYVTLDCGGEYRNVMRTRSPVIEQYALNAGAIQGFIISAGIQGNVVGKMGYRVGFGFERFVGDLPTLTGEGNPLTVRDRFISTDVALTYEM